MRLDPQTVESAVARLCGLYDEPFGGKRSGRYRLPARLLRKLTGRRRLYEDDIRQLARLLFERGYVLIDMESYFVVTSTTTFANYRRANDDCIDKTIDR